MELHIHMDQNNFSKHMQAKTLKNVGIGMAPLIEKSTE